MELTQRDIEALTRAFGLDRREVKIVCMLFAGVESNAELARRLDVSLPTAKLLMRIIYAKVHVHSKQGVILACLGAIPSAPDATSP